MQKFIKTSYIHTYIHSRYTRSKQNLHVLNPNIIVNQKCVYSIQIKLLNAVPLNIKICRNDAKGSELVFNEHIHAYFFYCEWEFTSICKKCKRFLASAAMYTRYALLYSTLRNITVEHRPQKRTFSSASLWWCGIVTFFQNRVMYGCSACVTIRMMLYLQYDKFHIINMCITYNVLNVHEFYSFLNKHNSTCTWCTTFKTFYLYLKWGVLESSYSQTRS